MRTFRYSKQCPEGHIFDTDGPDYPPSELNGWFDSPSKIHITQDQLIEAVVRAELAKQPAERVQLEAEFKDKTGAIPHALASEKTLVGVLDDNRAKERKRR